MFKDKKIRNTFWLAGFSIIFIINASGQSQKDSVKLKAKSYHIPVCYVANKNGDFTISQQALSIITQVQARYDDGSDMPATVESFEMVIHKKDGTVFDKSNTANMLTYEMKEQLSQLTKGEIIIIKKVVVNNTTHDTIQGVVMTVGD